MGSMQQILYDVGHTNVNILVKLETNGIKNGYRRFKIFIRNIQFSKLILINLDI